MIYGQEKLCSKAAYRLQKSRKSWKTNKGERFLDKVSAGFRAVVLLADLLFTCSSGSSLSMLVTRAIPPLPPLNLLNCHSH